MLSGTAAAARSSSEAAPMAASMVSSSAGRGPMCRSANGVPRSRSESAGRSVADRSVTGSSGAAGFVGLRFSSRSNRPPPLSPPGDRAPERFAPAPRPRRTGAFPVGGRARPSLSRGVSPARSWCLRGSGEELLLRRPAGTGTLPRGIGDYPEDATAAAGSRTRGSPPSSTTRSRSTRDASPEDASDVLVREELCG
jgi:hypothetical protein